jgi:uncharacterized phage protein (TIGR02220 family)
MSEDGRMLALYLMTCPHNTITGVFYLPDGYITDDIQWPLERVKKGFAELLAKGFANRCETTKWVWICKHLEWNPPDNPNQRKSAAKIGLSIPGKCIWKRAFMRSCAEALAIEWVDEPEPLPNPSETLSKPETETETGAETGERKTLSGNSNPDEKPAAPADPKPGLLKRQSIEILDFLNARTGHGYKPVPANVDLIAARLKEGFEAQDIKSVIAMKVREWKDDDAMRQYLRPATLFNRTNFAQYHGQLVQLPNPQQALEV